MKALIVTLILVSFLPLQVLGGCKETHDQPVETSGCHQEMKHEMPHSKINHKSMNHQLISYDHHEDSCNYCESGLCQLVQAAATFFKKYTLPDKSEICEAAPTELIPIDLFLMPNFERGPPVIKSQVRNPLLSYHSWQSRFSVFLI